jgi:flagellar P-ring protein precursor FlgI
MKRLRVAFFSIMLTCWATGQTARLKDIASIEGVRSNQLNGFGLVVGLNQTGDKDQTRFTTQALVNALAKSGIRLDATSVKVKNVAFVLVQAELPPFAQSGNRLDVTVSSYGDATSLQGGTLLWTELKGLDGQTYAIAQGPLTVGGFTAGGGGNNVTQNHPTVGRIPNGAMVERTVSVDLIRDQLIRFVFFDQDFTTVTRAMDAVNEAFGQSIATAKNPRLLEILMPPDLDAHPLTFISELENIRIAPDAPARVVINEKTGTIIMGQDVRIAQVAISHGNLTILVETTNQVVQPNALAEGETAVETNTQASATEQTARFIVTEEGVSLGAIAETLNALKVPPRDLISILQAIKEAGAMYAEIKTI